MIIIPAIDIIDGKVVRLCEGDYASAKKYNLTPLSAAQSFCDMGAKYLHVVDLDGAKSGRAENSSVIEEIVNKCNMSVEVGGGIRNLDQIQKYIDCGVQRVILGTIAVKDFTFAERATQKFGNKIAVGVDAKDGLVAVNGWKEITKINSLEFCKQLESIGVSNIIYTDISKDGMLNGTNLDVYKVLCQTLSLKITASGGISSVNDLLNLKDMGVHGAILGKALYENKLKLDEVLKLIGE